MREKQSSFYRRCRFFVLLGACVVLSASFLRSSSLAICAGVLLMAVSVGVFFKKHWKGGLYGQALQLVVFFAGAFCMALSAFAKTSTTPLLRITGSSASVIGLCSAFYFFRKQGKCRNCGKQMALFGDGEVCPSCGQKYTDRKDDKKQCE